MKSGRSPPKDLSTLNLSDRRLVEAADTNKSGITTTNELRKAAHAQTQRHDAYDLDAEQRRHRLLELAAQSPGGYLIDAELRAMPYGLRQLSEYLDNVWGDSDGKVGPAEFRRAAEYYLAALPFFTKEVDALLELAKFLGFDDDVTKKLADQRAHVDPFEVDMVRPFRELFDQAVKEAQVPGAPQLHTDSFQHNQKWHRLSILEHTAFAVLAVRELAKAAQIPWELLGATMLLHDVSKILTRGLTEGEAAAKNPFQFWDHEERGADWLSKFHLDVRDPKTGVQDPYRELVFLVRTHSVLRDKSIEDMVALAEGDPARLGRMMVVYLADQVAKGDTAPQLKSLAGEEPKIRELLVRAGIDPGPVFDAVPGLRARVVAQATLADQVVKPGQPT